MGTLTGPPQQRRGTPGTGLPSRSLQVVRAAPQGLRGQAGKATATRGGGGRAAAGATVTRALREATAGRAAPWPASRSQQHREGRRWLLGARGAAGSSGGGAPPPSETPPPSPGHPERRLSPRTASPTFPPASATEAGRPAPHEAALSPGWGATRTVDPRLTPTPHPRRRSARLSSGVSPRLKRDVQPPAVRAQDLNARFSTPAKTRLQKGGHWVLPPAPGLPEEVTERGSLGTDPAPGSQRTVPPSHDRPHRLTTQDTFTCWAPPQGLVPPRSEFGVHT